MRERFILIDGFRRPDLVGGLAEFVESAAGFSVLELPLLFELLDAFGQKLLWAAVGWFLETYRATFFVSDGDLALINKHAPRASLYLARVSAHHRPRREHLMMPNAI